MTIKLNSLARWSILKAGEAVVFDGLDMAERRVRIEFNCEAPTTVYIEDLDGNNRLLCTVPAGLETVEFNAAGTFSVFAAEGSGEVHYQSADLEPTYTENVDPEIFTQIAERRHRNPEFEELLYRSQMNTERRLAQQASEFEAILQSRLKEMQHAASDHAGTSSGAGTAQVSVESPAGEEPGEEGGNGTGGASPGGSDG